MARVIAIDYGTKRVGLAVTDEEKRIATALATIHAKDVLQYLKNYIATNNVEALVVGLPLKMDGSNSQSAVHVDKFVSLLAKTFPHLPIKRIDERFTSKIAFESMITMGLKKKDRAKKENVDMISAVIILQTYLETNI